MTTATEDQLAAIRQQLRQAAAERDRAVRDLASRQQAEFAAAPTQGARDRLTRLHNWQARELLAAWRKTIHALLDLQYELTPPMTRIVPYDYPPGERQKLLRIQRDD